MTLHNCRRQWGRQEEGGAGSAALADLVLGLGLTLASLGTQRSLEVCKQFQQLQQQHQQIEAE